MTPAPIYELRVLSGEQRGASSAVRLGDTLRLGRDWSNDVVLREAQGNAAQLSLDLNGSLLLNVDGGHCQVGDAPLQTGEHTALALYTPFMVGDTRMAVGRIGAPQWAALFDDAPAAPEADDVPAADPAPASTSAVTAEPARDGTHAPQRTNWVRRLLMGGVAMVGVSACALTLAWAMGPASLSQSQQAEQLRQTLAHLGFGALHVERRDGQLMVTGHLDTEAQRTKLEHALGKQSPARVAVWVNDQITAAVGDVYRLNGITAEVRSSGSGVVQVQTREGDIDALNKVQAVARRDVPGLKQLVSLNQPPPLAPRPETVVNDPGKRVAAIVPGDPPYVATADGTRYFQGAILPSGHRVVAILSDRVQIERDGVPSTLKF